MEQLSFERLPEAVAQLHRKLSEIESLLYQQSNYSKRNEDQWFDLNELMVYDPEKRSKPTFYRYVQEQSIPFHKKGKKLTFLKSEIDHWLKGGRKKTVEEIEEEAFNSIQQKKKGGRI